MRLQTLFLVLLFLAGLGGAASTAAQEKYAVIVGVENYDTSMFRNLSYANEDARALGDEFRKLEFQTTVLSGDAENARLRPTTPKKIKQAVETTLRSCDNDDVLIVALSGHGVQFSDEAVLPSGVRETYFCPSDADITDKSTLLKISEIVRLMNDSAAGRKLLLVDACQEQRLSARGRSKGAKRLELGSVHENRRSVPGGMSVLFSCSSGQFSWEDDALRHGVFTYHVLQYLRGKAASHFYHDKKLELGLLVAFVSSATNDFVTDKNLSPDGQFPVIRGNTSNWSLGVLRTPAERLLQRYLLSCDEFENLIRNEPFKNGEKSAWLWMADFRRMVAKLYLTGRQPEATELKRFFTRAESALEDMSEPEAREQFASTMKDRVRDHLLLTRTGLDPEEYAVILEFINDGESTTPPDGYGDAVLASLNFAYRCAELLEGGFGQAKLPEELQWVADQMTLQPLLGLDNQVFSGDDDASKQRKRLYDQICFSLRAKLLPRVYEYGRDYGMRYANQISTLNDMRADVENIVEHVFPGASLATVLGDLPISEEKRVQWLKYNEDHPLLIMMTFCNCGHETTAFEMLSEFRDKHASKSIQLVTIAFTEIAEQKLKELIENEDEATTLQSDLFRTEDPDFFGPSWMGSAPAVMLFNSDGKLAFYGEGVHESMIDSMESRIQ